MDEKQYSQAEKNFKLSLEKDPLLIDYNLFYLGYLYYKQNNYYSAIEKFLTVIENHSYSLWFSNALFYLGESYYQLEDNPNAIKYYSKFITTFRNSTLVPETTYRLAISFLRNNQPNKAIPFFKKIYINYPQTRYADFSKNELRTLSRQQSSALKFSSQEIFKRATQLNSYRKLDETLSELIKIQNQDFRITQKIRLLRIKTYASLQEFDKAKTLLGSESSIKNDPELAYWYVKLLIAQDEFDKAKEFHDTLPKMTLKTNMGQKTSFLLGSALLTQHEFDKSKDTFQTLLSLATSTYYHEESNWKLFWVYFLKKEYPDALSQLELLIKRYPRSEMIDRNRYWQARTYQIQNDTESAKTIYRTIIGQSPLTYYFFLSLSQLKDLDDSFEIKRFLTSINDSKRSKNKKITSHDFSSFDDSKLKYREHYLKGLRLLEMGFNKEASDEFYYVQRKNGSGKPLLYKLLQLYDEAKDFQRANYIAEIYFGNEIQREFTEEDKDLIYKAFPLAYNDFVERYSKQSDVDKYLIWSLMKAESNFNLRAKSAVGAMGLLQLMPTTGAKIAEKHEMADFNPEELFEPETNINFASVYIKNLSMKFKGHIGLIIPSYNAGPHKVKNWIKSEKKRMDEFVELIPYQETRIYARKALTYYQTYNSLYAKNESALSDFSHITIELDNLIAVDDEIE